jgi:hypothetical protein
MRVTDGSVNLRRFALIWCWGYFRRRRLSWFGRLARSSPDELHVIPQSDNMPQWFGSWPSWAIDKPQYFGADMSKRARKRRSRKGNAANHGRKPNA